jgi:hypothetical protein
MINQDRTGENFKSIFHWVELMPVFNEILK